MRLIDADKIIITRQEYVGALPLKGRLRRLLNFQPTVEAIPIEWIKKYIDSTLDEGNSQMLGFKAAIIKEMIEKWEKENDR